MAPVRSTLVLWDLHARWWTHEWILIKPAWFACFARNVAQRMVLMQPLARNRRREGTISDFVKHTAIGGGITHYSLIDDQTNSCKAAYLGQ